MTEFEVNKIYRHNSFKKEYKVLWTGINKEDFKLKYFHKNTLESEHNIYNEV